MSEHDQPTMAPVSLLRARPARRFIRRLRRAPHVQRMMLGIRFGDLRRTSPLTAWGFPRGTPVDRWYIESFLREHADLVSGQVLEVKEDLYASDLGAEQVHVVDLDAANQEATIVGDLCSAGTLPPQAFDAVLLTQTLQYLTAPVAAVQHVLASLRPGGTLLISVPCLGRLDGPTDSWRWTPTGLEMHLREAARASAAEVEVVGMGNSLAARAFLFGMAAEDLDPGVLAENDPDCPLVVVARLRVPC